MSSWQKWFQIISVNLILLLVLFVALDLAALGYLRFARDQRGLLQHHFPVVDITQIRKSMASPRRSYLKAKDNYFLIDPTLGKRFRPNATVISLESDEQGHPRLARERSLLTDNYGFIANTTPPQSINYAVLAKASDTFRVVVTGGSTVAGWGASSNSTTWPALLEGILQEFLDRRTDLPFRKAVVINCGVLGYGMSQEIKFFQEELIYLNPHAVISFNGINERWGYTGDPVSYTLNDEQRRIARRMNLGTQSRFMPFLFRALQSKSIQGSVPYGYRSDNYIEMEDTDLFLSKARQYRGLCREFDIPFLHVLQPVMGIGHKPLTREEIDFRKFFGTAFYPEPWDEYERRLTTFYGAVRKRLFRPWQLDLSGIFDNERRQVFADPRHYNDLGQEIIAAAIANELEPFLRAYSERFTGYPEVIDCDAPGVLCDSARELSFWYEQRTFELLQDGSTKIYICTRPFEASPETPWDCDPIRGTGGKKRWIRFKNDAKSIQRGVNVARNGSFESWSEEKPSAWRVPLGGVTRSNDATHGSAAVQLAHRSDTNSVIWQKIEATEDILGQLVEVRLSAKASGPKSLGLNFYYEIEGEEYARSLNHPGDGLWHTVRYLVEVPANADPLSFRVLVTLRTSADAPAIVDNLSVRPLY